MKAEKADMISDEYGSLLNQAKTLAAERKYDDALARLACAVSLETARPEAYNLIGAVIETCGDILLAQKYYRAALSFDPSYAPPLKNLDRTVCRRKFEKIALEE